MPALIAEGGFQEFTLKGGEWAVLLLSVLAALIAIAVGLFLAKGILKPRPKKRSTTKRAFLMPRSCVFAWAVVARWIW